MNSDLVVFVDEYLPFHPDNDLLGLEQLVTAEQYYPMLRKFFDYIETNYGVFVVIAAHPKAEYGNDTEYPEYFGYYDKFGITSRPVIKGDTSNLIRDSLCVMGHASTSLNLAVMFHKPVIFLTSKLIDKSYVGDQTKVRARWYGKIPVYMENPQKLDWRKELIVNDSAYRRYSNAYIKKEGTSNAPFWQQFADFIKNIGDT